MLFSSIHPHPSHRDVNVTVRGTMVPPTEPCGLSHGGDMNRDGARDLLDILEAIRHIREEEAVGRFCLINGTFFLIF